MNKRYDPNGVFRFKFYTHGKWRYVNVDDRLPAAPEITYQNALKAA